MLHSIPANTGMLVRTSHRQPFAKSQAGVAQHTPSRQAHLHYHFKGPYRESYLACSTQPYHREKEVGKEKKGAGNNKETEKGLGRQGSSWKRPHRHFQS